jgi:hypothetical protein
LRVFLSSFKSKKKEKRQKIKLKKIRKEKIFKENKNNPFFFCLFRNLFFYFCLFFCCVGTDCLLPVNQTTNVFFL